MPILVITYVKRLSLSSIFVALLKETLIICDILKTILKMEKSKQILGKEVHDTLRSLPNQNQ